MIWLLLACGPSQRALCRDATTEAGLAWDDTVSYYVRVSDMEADRLQAAEAQLNEASSRRAAAVASRNTYARRSVGGLTDVRTGAVHRDSDANAANRRRAAVASGRILAEAGAEAEAVADWLEAEHRVRELEERLDLAVRLRDGELPLQEAEALVDTTLAAAALRASRTQQRECSVE